MKSRIRAILALVLTLSLLCACRRGDYPDASERVPNNWAVYAAEELSFRFEAGFTREPISDLVETLAYSVNLLGDTNRLSVLGHFRSPLRDKGTSDFLTLGLYRLDRVITAADLETLMEGIDRTGTALSEGQMSASILQNAHIRTYGSVTALTFSLKLSRGEVSCIMQIALVPNGDSLYQILYSDFTSSRDNVYLERLLSSLSFPLYQPPEEE